MRRLSNSFRNAMLFFFTLVIFLFCLVLPGPLIAQEYGSISGTVYNADGDISFDQAVYVQVVQGDPCGHWEEISQVNINPATGAFALYGVPAEQPVFVRISNTGFTNVVENWWNSTEGSTNCGDAEEITLSSGQELTDLSLFTRHAGSISGTVFEADGVTPVDNLHVYALTAACGGIWLSGANTDDTGQYTLTGIPEGTVYIRTCTECNDHPFVNQIYDGGTGTLDCDQGLGVEVAPGETTPGIDFRLESGVTISGRVTDTQGNPIPDLWLHAIDNACDGEWLGGGRTDEQGYYTTHAMPPGDAYIEACPDCDGLMYINSWWTGTGNPGSTDCEDAQNLDLQAGVNVTDIDFQLNPLATISGTVFDIDGVTRFNQPGHVYLLQGDDPCQHMDYYKGIHVDPETGEFMIQGITPGRYYIRIDNTEETNLIQRWWNSSGGSIFCHEAEPIDLSVGQHLEGVTLTTEPGGTVSGTVYESDGTTPIPDLHLWAQSHACGGIHLGGTSTDAQGNYVLRGLPAGTVHLYACPSCSENPFVDGYYNGGTSTLDCNQAVDIPVVIGETTPDIDFSLMPAGNVSGRVTESDGVTPIPNLHVYAADEPCGGNWLAGTNTDENGYYTLSLIPAGTAYIRVCGSCNGLGFLDVTYDGGTGSPDCNEGMGVVVSHGQTTLDINFSLAQGMTVSGTLFHDDGTTSFDQPVHINMYQGDPCHHHEHVAGTVLDPATGMFEINGVPPGEYYLVVNNSDTEPTNVVRRWWNSSGGSIDCADAEPITLTQGQNWTDMQFQTAVGGIVSGIVQDMDGQPIQGLKIEIWSNKCWENFLGQAYTDADGTFRAEGLPAQEVYLRTCADCDNRNYIDLWWDQAQGTTDCNQAVPVQVSSGLETPDIHFTLGAGNTRIYWSQVSVTQGIFNAGFDIFPGYDHLIQSASLAGPNGFFYEFDLQNDTFSWLNECNYMIAWNKDFGDTFDYGLYTFTITFKDGYQEINAYELYYADVIPVNIAAMSHTVNPDGSIDFSWTNPDPNQRYQVRIYQNGERVYRSSQVLNMGPIHVPADQLRCVIPGSDAVWEVRSYENSPTENAIERSGFLPLDYDPAALDNRAYWFQALKTQADPDFLNLYFNVRPGSREQVTSGVVTGPDGLTLYSFDLVDDWFDLSTESRRLNGWSKTISTEVVPILDGNYTLTVSFDDGHVEIHGYTLEADVLAPVDEATMGYEIFENGAMRFYWTLPDNVTGQHYQVRIRNQDRSREYVSSYSVLDHTEIWLSKWDLRALPHAEQFWWIVRSYDDQWDTMANSSPQLFTYNPFDIPRLVEGTVVLSEDNREIIISADKDAVMYGTSLSDRIILESNARVELIHSRGDNEIVLQSMSEGFTVSRSGTVVTLQGTDGTRLIIPATLDIQSIRFSDATLNLTIQGNRILLGDQEVTQDSEPIEQ